MLREGRTASFVVRLPDAKPSKPSKPAHMVHVEAGPFIMGSDGEKNASPKRHTTLRAFWIDRYEASVGDYARCVREGACSAPSLTAENCSGPWTDFNHWSKEGAKPGRLRQPINCVSWSQARAFCAWAGKRLPTEAEWEKTARGTDGRRYPWGSTPPGSPKTELGNFADRAASRAFPGWEVLDGYDDGHIGTAPVDAFPDGASPYGAEQLAGNVWEWVEDAYDPAWYAQAPVQDPLCRLPSTEKVIRGGSMYMAPAWLRTYARGHQQPDTAADSVGFRCALDG
jgi:formylglycine-generating enzyme required for sulfatase activity